MLSSVVIFTLLGGVLALPKDNIGGRITGGKESTPNSRPYEVYLEIIDDINNWEWECGGALISHYYILTAAHCIDTGSYVLAYLGAHNMEKEESERVQYESDKLIQHEKYHEDGTNDIALIKLKLSVTYTTAISPIALPTDSNALFVGDKALIAGWGYTDMNNPAMSSVLMEAEVTILEHTTCSDSIKQLCTSFEDDKSGCYGDSGSGLIDNNRVIGICSAGAENCTGWPTIYTNVAYFIDWIKTNSDVK